MAGLERRCTLAFVSFIDHVFVALFVFAYPLAGVAGFRRMLRRLAEGRQLNRGEIYRNTMIGHWLLLAFALAIWFAADRRWSELGLGWSMNWRFVAGVAGVLIAVTMLTNQLREVAGADKRAVAKLRQRFGRLAAIVPGNRAELRRFYAVSVTAGIVEEVLWRGFLIWYLGNFWPLWAAALFAAVGFGLAHAYQGWRQVPMVTGAGALLTALYLLTGTLWLSIALHAAIDILQGRLAFEIKRRHRDMEAAAAQV